MANEQNLKPWKPGTSGNPSGKPKGTKHLSSWIQEMMEDDKFMHKLANGKNKKEVPVKAIIAALITKALEGDMKAFELLARYGYGTRIDLTSNHKQIPTPILIGMNTDNYLSNIQKSDNSRP